jgi:DNA-directed RNA polymerase beta' subunit
MNLRRVMTVKIDLFNVDDFVKINQCPQVTNPVFFNYDKTPTSDGLFSYELFGVSDNDRKNIFGYVDLKGPYIHPLIFGMMTKRMGALRDLLSGNKYAIIQDRKIVFVPEDFEGAETGLGFIYDNFEKINWLDEIEEKEMDSIDKKTRLKFLRSIKKEEFFVTKWLIVPPFYRAESSENKTLGDEINEKYKDLISRTNAMRVGFGLGLFGDQTKFKIQMLLIDLFNETTRPIRGKGSMLRKHLLGKTVDYTASNVITSPAISNTESVDDMPVKFGYGAFPLATVLSLFHPFIVSTLTDYLSRIFRPIVENEVNFERTDLSQFNSDAAEKMIKSFIKSTEERFAPLEFEYVEKSKKNKILDIIIEECTGNYCVERELTILDIIYMVSMSVASDKHVYVTRYPVTNFQNIYPSKVTILTTNKTKKNVKLKLKGIVLNDIFNNGKDFDNYPYIKFEDDPKPAPSTYYSFLNVFMPGNVYLKALGGDYDGDMLYMRGVFTKEANAEAEKLIYAKSNILTANGSTSRGISKIGKDAIMALYELTKEGK